jgi:hypothetical protein
VTDGLGEHSSLPIILLIAPCAGKLHILKPKMFHGGSEWVEQGQEVAVIEHGNGESEPVKASSRGRLGGLMGRDGEPVRSGQPVAWMEAIGDETPWIKPVRDPGDHTAETA